MDLEKEIIQLEELEKELLDTRKEFVIRWAEFIKTHPESEWRPQHTKIVNREMKKLEVKYKGMTREQIMNVRCDLSRTPKSRQNS
jgi:hypothetical protein